MAKFIYRMQNILNLDEKLEEQAKMEYAAQQLALNEAEEQEDALKRRRASYEEEARRLRGDSLNVRDMIANAQAIDIMGDLIVEQHKVVQQEETKLEVKRSALEEAMKDRKTQEKLKEKAFDDFKAELAMEESKQIDQLTSYTFGIKRQKQN
ncbi:MAG: flagellar export protein FliJ [Lachnospiraceae bacterium]|nr:flagellar export protein FliJ [Lachnospiraceae bacterium]MBR1523390.1 flagellar export protein FliJ [Lachnospiraceae bacterium]